MIENFTHQDMYELCDKIKPCSSLVTIYFDTKEHISYLTDILNYLKKEKGLHEDAHLNAGIISCIRDKNDKSVTLRLRAALHPTYDIDGYKETYYKEFDPMVSVLAHCYDPVSELYLFHKRGKKMNEAGKIQIAAGFVEYEEGVSGAAVRELKEEMKIEGRLVMPPGIFLDITPHQIFSNLEAYPNPCFSYITKANLTDVKNRIDDVSQIAKLNDDTSLETSAVFVVSLDDLPKITEDLENEEMFYGPMNKTINSFINWLGQKK